MIGDHYASQVIRSSLRAHIRFLYLENNARITHGMFCLVLGRSRDMEEIRWDNSCASCSEIVFGIFTFWLVPDVTFGSHGLLIAFA